MKKLMSALLITLGLLGLASCDSGGGSGHHEPSWHYNCYPVYDYYGYYLYDDCYWEYYNQDGTVTQELDLSGEVADREALILSKTAEVYAEKFSLSQDKAMKIAKNVKDFAALQDRTESDIADFAQKLYGVNPSEIASAVANAQVGNNSEMEAVIEQAAQNFNTSKDTMKAIVKELHGKALEANGIEL